MVDVAIIGCGIVGASVAYELSKYSDLNVCIIEKENDVSTKTTKANSAIVHAGYDPKPGTLMAKLNVRGNEIIHEIVKDLDIPFIECGSLVLAFDDDELKTLETLYKRGLENKVLGLSLLNKEQTLKKEPNVTKDVKGSLYAKSAGIISPWEFALALAEISIKNGVKLKLNSKVESIDEIEGGYKINTNNEEIKAKYVINAAGVHSDEINRMVSKKNDFKIIPGRGEYYVLDKCEGKKVNSVIFQCPTKKGKGILVARTVHGNLIVGPNNEKIDNKDDVKTTKEGLEEIAKLAKKSIPSINLRENIRNFSGVRANSDKEDFIIEEVKDKKGFINLAGIKSPGLTAAPAIAELAVSILKESGLKLEKKQNFYNKRKRVKIKELNEEEKNKLIKQNPKYGRVICRCEKITEGEILDTFKTPIPPRSLDGIKRRCNPGLGRCQGGFCGPTIVSIISKELNIPPQQVLKDMSGSYILKEKTKEEE